MGNTKSTANGEAQEVFTKIPHFFDYSKSTEDNYSTSQEVYVGKFAELRKLLDYSYHKHYTEERQLKQDKMMMLFDTSDSSGEGIRNDDVLTTFESEKSADVSPRARATTASGDSSRDTETDFLRKSRMSADNRGMNSQRNGSHNWLVFTAGAMGAGKTHTLLWLSRRDQFPLDSFVRIDPDSLRDILPETKEYRARDQSTAAMMTQKEVGYMAEILSLYALRGHKNVLVDGSLRNAEWYKQYINSLRNDYPELNIAIMHILAPAATVFSRCRRREAVTGRHVPDELVQESMHQLPVSIAKLAPFVDVVITFENDDAKPGMEDAPVVISSPAITKFGSGSEDKATNENGECPRSLTDLAPKTMSEFKQLFQSKYRHNPTGSHGATGSISVNIPPRSASFNLFEPKLPEKDRLRGLSTMILHQGSAILSHNKNKNC